MGKQCLWLDYRLVLLLTGVVCAFEVDQPFAIHVDVRRTLDDSMRIGKSCERKMSAMDSFLENFGKQAKLNFVSIEKVENLEKRLNSCVLKQNALENTLQSLTTRSKETMNELKENALKLRSTAADLASKIERG
ncbi:uncharacterized protein LOC105228565 [Bactrocera dorsalis]|uniref:Uncharacterized protein LOC105228565 n=1 Tax=Bactrocera dorsalis TaxID=27457 RepID=A0A6I9VBG8_BACDO|nr:uncharacterized protein LOC105228565 [Bactrocera dorsalis]